MVLVGAYPPPQKKEEKKSPPWDGMGIPHHPLGVQYIHYLTT